MNHNSTKNHHGENLESGTPESQYYKKSLRKGVVDKKVSAAKRSEIR